MFSLRSVGESTKGEEVELHQVSFCPLHWVSYQQGEHDLDERVHIFEVYVVFRATLFMRKNYNFDVYGFLNGLAKLFTKLMFSYIKYFYLNKLKLSAYVLYA